jgi:hypothetical protein
VTTFPMIENLTALVDAVWVYSSRTLDTATPAASNGSYLDDIGHAVWTYTDRSVINPPPVPITAISAMLLGGGGITSTRVVQLACGGINAGYRRLRVNGGGLAFPVAPVVTPTNGSLNVKMLPDCHASYDPAFVPTSYELYAQPKFLQITPTDPRSLLHHMYWQQKANIAGGQTGMFTTKNHSTQTYVRARNTLAGHHDLSCISVWNSTRNELACCTAITRRHGLTATHYPPAVGATVRFVTHENEVVNRTVAQLTQLPHLPEIEFPSDSMIVTLNADLPESIVPAQFAPADFYEYITWAMPGREFYNQQDLEYYLNVHGPNGGNYVPLIYHTLVPPNHYPFLFRRRENSLASRFLNTRNIAPESYSITTGVEWVWDRVTLTEFQPFSQTLIGGDSGGPFFGLVNGRVVILGTALSNSGGPSFHNRLSRYEALTDGLPIEVANFSMFDKQPSGYEGVL